MSNWNLSINRNKAKKGRKVDPHHCTCFSIQKECFFAFETRLKNLDFIDPFFDEDHGQILSYVRRISENYQIHVKLMRTGRIEAEIEYPHDYPMAHLNPTHSFSAHPELHSVLISMQIPFKSRRSIPITCKQRQIIPAQQPTHMNTFLAAGGILAGLDILLNEGKLTTKAVNFVLKEAAKSANRRIKRRRYLLPN